MSWRIMMESVIGSEYETEQEAEEAKKRAQILWDNEDFMQKPRKPDQVKFTVVEVVDDGD